VLLEEQIYIYDIQNMKLLHTIETSPNPGAISSLSSSSDSCYLVYPSSAPPLTSLHLPSHAPNSNGTTTTATAVDSTSPSRTGEVTVFDAESLQPVNVIEAHKSPLSVLSLNSNGTLLATASDKGTIIRIFSIPNGTKLYQFRRGTYPSRVFSINFNLASSLLCVSSATETIHIFKLSSTAKTIDNDDDSSLVPQSSDSSKAIGMDAYIESKRNGMANLLRRSSQTIGRQVAGAVGGYLPNAVTDIWEPKQRDFAFIKLPAPPGTKSVVALSNLSQHALVVTSEGYFYQYGVDLENGGECELIKQYSLLDNEDK
jgi:autophagy-related protein 18